MLPTQIKDHTHAYAQVECCVAIEGLGQPVPFTRPGPILSDHRPFLNICSPAADRVWSVKLGLKNNNIPSTHMRASFESICASQLHSATRG